MTREPSNALTVWSRLVAATLVAGGLRDVVVSPGSRSTPFLLALHERSELRLTTVLDERAAAFVALGMARVTGVPAAVLATSGTAAAHWYPAVIEASIAHDPLLLLSADRPLGLANAGAAQTIDQTKLFGHWARFFTDLGDPRGDERALEGVVRQLAMAIAYARGPSAGPVHVDLRADKPLELVGPRTDIEEALARTGRSIAARGLPHVSASASSADESFAAALASALTRARRPLVVAGPRHATADVGAIIQACERLQLAVAAEATSQLRWGPRASLALDASELMFTSERFARDHAPDLILQIGSLPTAPTLERAWSHAERFVLDVGGVHDPLGFAAAISTSPAGPTLARSAALATAGARDAAWLGALRRAEGLAWSEVERSIASGRGEGAVVRAACAASGGATLVIGNSLPIRTLDRFVPGGTTPRRVLSQRGANGIDGLVSGAIGAALVDEGPVLAIVGDVSFVHDLNALLAASTVRRPLVVLVVDNGGGRIFESLPIAQTADAATMALFTTPHGIDLTMAARAYGVTCLETRDAAETARAISSAMREPRLTVVRAIVDPSDAHTAFRALAQAFDARFFAEAA